MNISKSQFKILVAVQLSLGICSVLAGVLGEDTLPKELQVYLKSMAQETPSVIELIVYGVAVIGIISNFGILFYVKWSRKIFTLSYLLTCVGMIFLGPTIQTALVTSIGEIELFLAGFIVACMYLTDINLYFQKQSA